MGGSEWSALIGRRGQATITSAAAELVRCEGVMLSFVLAVVVVTNGIDTRLAAAFRACGYLPVRATAWCNALSTNYRQLRLIPHTITVMVHRAREWRKYHGSKSLDMQSRSIHIELQHLDLRVCLILDAVRRA